MKRRSPLYSEVVQSDVIYNPDYAESETQKRVGLLRVTDVCPSVVLALDHVGSFQAFGEFYGIFLTKNMTCCTVNCTNSLLQFLLFV